MSVFAARRCRASDAASRPWRGRAPRQSASNSQRRQRPARPTRPPIAARRDRSPAHCVSRVGQVRAAERQPRIVAHLAPSRISRLLGEATSRPAAPSRSSRASSTGAPAQTSSSDCGAGVVATACASVRHRARRQPRRKCTLSSSVTSEEERQHHGGRQRRPRRAAPCPGGAQVRAGAGRGST